MEKVLSANSHGYPWIALREHCAALAELVERGQCGNWNSVVIETRKTLKLTVLRLVRNPILIPTAVGNFSYKNRKLQRVHHFRKCLNIHIFYLYFEDN